MSRKSIPVLFCILFAVGLVAGCTEATEIASQPTLTEAKFPASQTAAPPANTPLPTATPTVFIKPTRGPTVTFGPSQTPKATLTKTATLVVTVNVTSCPGAPAILLKRGDWARVSVDPPLANKVRSQPGVSAELTGHVQPGESVLVVDGPVCADGYTWWFVRSLAGLEGWTAEGDAQGYWLVEPISVWYPLPYPIRPRGTTTFELRELNISPDSGLVSEINGSYYPLATPMPRPQNEETPEPDDPRYSEFGSTAYAAHSLYGLTITNGDSYVLWVYDLEDPLSRYYLNRMSYTDCTEILRKNLEGPTIEAEFLKPFCGINGGIPLLFKADIQLIQFSGGKGVRYLMASANYQTVDHMEYRFQGLSDDGRYYISGLFRPILHPYIIDDQLIGSDFGWLLAWREGQYEQAQASYDVFNARIEAMLNAGVVTLYPALELLDEMVASIVMK